MKCSSQPDNRCKIDLLARVHTCGCSIAVKVTCSSNYIPRKCKMQISIPRIFTGSPVTVAGYIAFNQNRTQTFVSRNSRNSQTRGQPPLQFQSYHIKQFPSISYKHSKLLFSFLCLITNRSSRPEARRASRGTSGLPRRSQRGGCSRCQ